MSLPTDPDRRKQIPIFTGVMMYFPDALAAIAEVSRIGNEQHNPGEPLHWAREKSTDQMNTSIRHQMDHAMGRRYDTDGSRHLAKACWRMLAELQLDIEREQDARTEERKKELAGAQAQRAFAQREGIRVYKQDENAKPLSTSPGGANTDSRSRW